VRNGCEELGGLNDDSGLKKVIREVDKKLFSGSLRLTNWYIE